MLGRWRSNRSGAGTGAREALSQVGTASGFVPPPGAGLLGCRVFDPVNEPLDHAEFTLDDTTGRRVLAGQVDSHGAFVVAVPAGDYRIGVQADGYAPWVGNVTVVVNKQVSLGEVVLQVAHTPSLPGPGDWEIDPVHSSITFAARHLGIARIHGRFDRFAGVVRIGERMEESGMHVVIDPASIDTNARMRDDHLRSIDFLDVVNYPTLEFYSERFTHRGGVRWDVTGVLTLHGVSRTVTLDTEYLGSGTGMMGEQRAACHATTELHREDFQLTWQIVLERGIAALGSSITVDMDVQVVPKVG
jgi:polyisoprenoid-binding protein YceI